MILCPNCQHHEITGALFCSECGAQLIILEPVSTQALYHSQSDQLQGSETPAPTKPPTSPLPQVQDVKVTLHLVDHGNDLPLAGRTEYTLGRVAEGQPILPDVDLSMFDAYSKGVSRLHSSLKINNQRVTVVDLGSSNGTRVNGQKIAPNVDYPINNGDIISLGKMKIQVLIHR
jgi:hypothetical protein